MLLPHQDSVILKQRLLERLSEDFDGDAFDKAYASLVNKFEPYELEQFTVFTNEKQR